MEEVFLTNNLYTVEEAAMYLGLSQQTIRRYIREKKISAYKYQRSYRISTEAISQFLKERHY